MPAKSTQLLEESPAAQVRESPFAVVRATVAIVELISPSFVRVTFQSAGVNSLCTVGHTFDQRVKVIFPSLNGGLPAFSEMGDEWYPTWLTLPEQERGSIRTYSIRDVSVDEMGSTSLVIDFVLHLAEGATGPASLWASQAKVGDEVMIVGPRRGRLDGGGIEYEPAPGQEIILAGDETAAPAIARILEDIPQDTRGIAFIEVPVTGDRLHIDAPSGVEVRWLARTGAAHGELLAPAVMAYLAADRRTNGSGSAATHASVPEAPADASLEDAVEPDPDEPLVWETPVYSAAGEEVGEVELGSSYEQYFWIAGESKVVTGIRRQLVKELGIARGQVAFMGYWRQGVAMKG